MCLVLIWCMAPAQSRIFATECSLVWPLSCCVMCTADGCLHSWQLPLVAPSGQIYQGCGRFGREVRCQGTLYMAPPDPAAGMPDDAAKWHVFCWSLLPAPGATGGVAVDKSGPTYTCIWPPFVAKTPTLEPVVNPFKKQKEATNERLGCSLAGKNEASLFPMFVYDG